MPKIACPFPSCGYATDDLDAVTAAAQLTIHGLTHSNPGATMGSQKQKPPKIVRPIISRGTSEEEWLTFTKKWNLFKGATDIPNTQVTTQLWQCCDKDLENDLFKDVPDISRCNENDLFKAIKQLAVITVAASVRRAELLSMQQDHGQPIRSFAAQVKGKAQTCAFAKNCSNCSHSVDYTEDIVKYILISGVADEDIKKEVLGQVGLDDKSLNDTSAIIENKEMATRAMQLGSTGDTIATNNDKNSKDFTAKLAIKAKCKSCSKPFQKFKLRRGKWGKPPTLREFVTCVDCWKSTKREDATTVGEKPTTGALFDVVAGINHHTSVGSSKRKKKTNVKLDHHIFDGSYGWMVAESKSQPSINLTISTSQADYVHLHLPFPKIAPKKVTAITDTGAQSSLMGLKVFSKCGFRQESLLPVKRKMYAANNEDINILGAVFVRLSGNDRIGQKIQSAEMVYVSDSTDFFYLSRHSMEQLKIIGPSFPEIGAAIQATINDTNELPQHHQAPCECPVRQPPPQRPDALPFDPKEENNESTTSPRSINALINLSQ